ncbi:hypothetical protein C4569_00315 [Candidatus Parcubacteria bacterium]|nr:MAG: hypothetical protein C4569_00315 [Candidatus Parcubacteria bacterium]
MENVKQELSFPLSPAEEYYPDWGYNPDELLLLSVWHKKPLPEEAITKIKKAFNEILGRE